MNREASLSEAALKYASRGWHVLPLHWPVNGHCSCGNLECSSQAKHPLTQHGLTDASINPKTIQEWWAKWPEANIGIRTGAISGLVVLDIDPRHDGDESLIALETKHGELPHTVESLTGGGGRHIFFQHPGGNFSNKVKLFDLSGIDIRGDGGYIVAPPSLHISGRGYVWEVLSHPDDIPIESFPSWLEPKKTEAEGKNAPGWIAEALKNLSNGNRNATFCKIAGRLNRDGYLSGDIIALLLPKALEVGFTKEELEKEIQGICDRYPSAKNVEDDSQGYLKKEIEQWPKLNEAAYFGLVGDIVKMIEPHTEADPVAILLNLLTATGNIVGDSAHFLIEYTKHPLRLFVAQVGKSSIGRKGLALSAPKHMFGQVDSEWFQKCVTGGLSSGEGVIYAVRDQQTKFKNGVEEIADRGVSDKRLMLIESEFSKVLKVSKRDGNTLSSILRHAWDDGNLRSLTKNDPITATGAHISIIAHITQDELLKLFDDVDMANGYGNRFLWALIKRSKKIPLPKGAVLSALNAHIAQLSQVIEFGKSLGTIEMGEETVPYWEEVYDLLTDDRPGLLGALLNRAATHVLRLSCIYAVLAKSQKIQLENLKAALAVWEYCEESAKLIFKDYSGDSVADRIFSTLKESKGMTKTEIDSLFGRHGYRRIDFALESLAKNGKIYLNIEATGGRSRQVWRVAQKA